MARNTCSTKMGQEGAASLQMVVAVVAVLLVLMTALSFCWGMFACVALSARLNAAVAAFDFSQLSHVGSNQVREVIKDGIAQSAPGVDPDFLEVEVTSFETECQTQSSALSGSVPEGYTGLLEERRYLVHVTAEVTYSLPMVSPIPYAAAWKTASAQVDRTVLAGTEVLLW